MKRKAAKRHARRGKVSAVQPLPTATISTLPMEIQIGDRFTDHDYQWEVVTPTKVAVRSRT